MEGIQYSMRPQHFFSFNFRLLEADVLVHHYVFHHPRSPEARAKDIRTDDRMLDLE